jgi:hypothetical protein
MITADKASIDARLAEQLQQSGTRYTMRTLTPDCDRR